MKRMVLFHYHLDRAPPTLALPVALSGVMHLQVQTGNIVVYITSNYVFTANKICEKIKNCHYFNSLISQMQIITK